MHLKDTQNEKSIAVLPFVNMSHDPENEYFSDGITEEIINALTRVAGLKVIARTSSFSFKNKNIDVREIAKQVGVTTILEGSVRKAGQRVRITAQLIDGRDGTHIWSKNFDRELEDIFAVQDEISLLIANQIRENFGHLDIKEHLVGEQTSSLMAYELFLKGRFHQLKWDEESISMAATLYEESVQHDPNFSRSYYGAVQCYGLLAAWGYMPAEEGYGKAIMNFLKARELDTKSAEYSMCYVGRSFWQEWDFQATYHQLMEILKTHPTHGDSLEATAELMLAHGHFAEAEKYVQDAIRVDPLSPNHHYTLANIYYHQKRFKEALEWVSKALIFRPAFPLAKVLRMLCFIWLNKKTDFDIYISEVEKADELKLLFDVFNGGVKEISPTLLDEWRIAASHSNQLIPLELYILANTAHQQEAMDLLQKYIEQKRGQIINFRYEPLLKPLHDLPGFSKLYPSALEFITRVSSAVIESNNKVDTEEMKIFKEKLLNFLEKEMPYLNPQLSLSSLADDIGLHPNQLSLLINEMLGKNFNELINSYRLESFKERALNPANSHLTLLSIAYESGFNSKTVFNAFFKKVEGITPSAWVKEQRLKK